MGLPSGEPHRACWLAALQPLGIVVGVGNGSRDCISNGLIRGFETKDGQMGSQQRLLIGKINAGRLDRMQWWLSDHMGESIDGVTCRLAVER